jgi:hypothetical protein
MGQAEHDYCTEPDLDCAPIQRRLWLLTQAMAKFPMAEALALACKAEAFLTNGACGPTLRGDGAMADPSEHGALCEARSCQEALDQAAALPPAGEAAPESSQASGIDRETLFTRLAQGATNVELAKQFGLTQRQIQGFRMQMGRQKPAEAPAPDEIVRFLRREGDVVVGAGDDQFIVNGRFRMTLTELTDRANRMRARQGKSPFTKVAASAAACAIAALGVMN